MLSLARSRYTLYSQFVFTATNAFGLLLGTIYNANTPDLYPNNAHHKLGWIVTWVVSAQVVIGLLGRVAGVLNSGEGHAQHSVERQSFMPVSTEAMEEHESRWPKLFRHSNDSGQGTEPESPTASGFRSPPIPLEDVDKEYEEEDIDLESLHPESTNHGKAHGLAKRIADKVSSRAWKVLLFGYNFVDRTILILGFVALATGIVTYARFFVRVTGPFVCCRRVANSGDRKEMPSSVDWRTGSRAAPSFGTAFSLWAAGPDALASLDGYVPSFFPDHGMVGLWSNNETGLECSTQASRTEMASDG
jgi:hypothetical protein